MMGETPKVFISYSHDTVEHQKRVLGFADRLRADGIDAEIDQYNAAPPEGWVLWCERQLKATDFVLMVCTETYHRRVSGDEERGKGLGVVWEARIIRQLLYDAGAISDKFVPALFSDASIEQIPTPIKSWTHYVLDTENGYEKLYRRLTGQPRLLRPALGRIRTLPTRSQQWLVGTMEAATASAVLHNVPELPPHFLPRPDAFDGLKRKLLGSNGGAVAVTGVATLIGVQGMGGIGKSVLTAVVVRDDEVRSAFPAGIFWISLGQMPNVLTRQADLYWLLTREKGGFADAQQGRIALQEALRGRSCLVVLDDVWQLTTAEAFNVLDADARLLLTTRDAAIVKGIGAREHEVDRLDSSASRRLLAKTAGIAAETLPADVDAIAHECGDLPLALALAGGMIEGRADMWSLVLEALRAADWQQITRDFAGYPYPHVFAAIEASVNALGADCERYLDLAVFPEDVPIPEAALKTLWADLKPLQVHNLVTRFHNRSLARFREDKRLTLHDLQHDFVRKRASDLPARHQRLVEAYRSHCSNVWASGPDDGYFFQHLPLHLAQAGHHDELKALLADDAWRAAKERSTEDARMASLHEAYHSTLNDSTAFGALMHVVRVLARELPNPAHYSDMLTRLHNVALHCHETYSTYSSMFIVGKGSVDTALTYKYRYQDYLETARLLVRALPNDLLGFLLLQAVCRTCMQADCLSPFLDMDPIHWRFESIPHKFYPDRRLETLLNANIGDRAYEHLCKWFDSTPAHSKERWLLDIRRADHEIYSKFLDTNFDRTSDAVGHLFYDSCRDILVTSGLTCLDYNGHQPFVADLIRIAENALLKKVAGDCKPQNPGKST